jgi:hypothetical protein
MLLVMFQAFPFHQGRELAWVQVDVTKEAITNREARFSLTLMKCKEHSDRLQHRRPAPAEEPYHPQNMVKLYTCMFRWPANCLFSSDGLG